MKKKYIVIQIVLKEKLVGFGSGNLYELEDILNEKANEGYRLHSISTSTSQNTGVMGGERIHATMVFERID